MAVQPTFNWNGLGTQEDDRIYFSSFQFCQTKYQVGDHVYLLPEDEGAPLYIAKILKAFEDTTAEEGERLCIEVQWYERKANLPLQLQANMHDREVLESDMTDTNLVGCIDRKAAVFRARCYEEALEMVLPEHRNGEWHFCRGMLNSETATFRMYDDLNETFGKVDPLAVQQVQRVAAGLVAAGNNGYDSAGLGRVPGGVMQLGAGGLPLYEGGFHGDPHGGYKEHSHHSGLSRRGGGGLAYMEVEQPMGGHHGGSGGGRRQQRRQPQFAPGPNAGKGVPGKICAECGATQTPQWREGPLGPKTLCNACGVRYQRSQSKGKNQKRVAGERRQASPPTRAPMPKYQRTAHAHGHHTRYSRDTGVPMGRHGGGGHHGGGHGGMGGRQRWDMSRGGYYHNDEGVPLGMPTHILPEEGDDSGLGEDMGGAQDLQRTKTQEAAELLSTFKVNAMAALPPLTSHLAAASPGSEGRMLHEHLAGEDLVPLLQLDDRGRPGTPTSTGYAQDPLHVPSPLRLHHNRGAGGHRGMSLKEAHPSPLLTHSRSPIPSGMAELPPLPESGHTFSLLTDPPHLPPGAGSLGGGVLRGGPGASLRGAAAAAAAAQDGGRVGASSHLGVSGESWTAGTAAADIADVTYEMAGAAAAAAAAAGATAGIDLEVTADELMKLWQRVTKYAPELGQKTGGVMTDNLSQVLALLPRERVARLVGIKAAVEAAANEAKAADAAVAAVSQVLQQKQKVAEKAHNAAAQAVQQFREFLLGCLEQYQETGVLQSGAAATQQAGAGAGEAVASAATPVEGAAAAVSGGGVAGAEGAIAAAPAGPAKEEDQGLLGEPEEGSKVLVKQEAGVVKEEEKGAGGVEDVHVGNVGLKKEENVVEEVGGVDGATRDQQQQQHLVGQKQLQALTQQQQQQQKGKPSGKSSGQQAGHNEANGHSEAGHGVADNGLMGQGGAAASSAAHTAAETTPVAA